MTDPLKKVRRLAARADRARGDFEAAIVDAVAAGRTQRQVAAAAGFANHRAVQVILKKHAQP